MAAGFFLCTTGYFAIYKRVSREKGVIMAEINTEELAVQPEFVWEHFTIRDGLPDMKIECIYEDSQGLVWVGTHEGGLACYDGHRFTTYSSEDWLAGNGVFSAIEDDSGYMWFGTNRGLSRFDGGEF